MRVALSFALAVALCAGCILPDRDIRFESGLDNESAVRIVQRAPMTAQMDDLCNPEDPEDSDTRFCPQVLRTPRSSGLVRAADGDFCVCPNGDRRAISSFEIYAEDGDREGDATQDTLFGVLQLDPAAQEDDPQHAKAYEDYWEPGRAGERINDGDDTPGDRTEPPNGREPAGLTRFALDDSSGQRRIDLCNEAGRPVAVGLHTMRFMVTDRPFFRPRMPNLDGTPADDANGDPAFGNEQPGVPDLAGGATFATIDYVFECRDPTDPEADCLCDEA